MLGQVTFMKFPGTEIYSKYFRPPQGSIKIRKGAVVLILREKLRNSTKKLHRFSQNNALGQGAETEKSILTIFQILRALQKFQTP